MNHPLKSFDVIIVGGSYAGLSAAMSLARSRRNILIIDSGLPCNRQTPHSHNFITHDGTPPAAISTIAREQVLRYPTVTFIHNTVDHVIKHENRFTITTRGQEVYESKKLILATGIKDLLPKIPGLQECWGITAIHCPYCHGYEFADQPTGILAHGERAIHLMTLVYNLTQQLTLFTQGESLLTEDQRSMLRKKNIELKERRITKLHHHQGTLVEVEMEDGTKYPLRALYVAAPFEQASEIPKQLGCAVTEQGYIAVNAMHETSIPGVYACGDNTNMMRSVSNAIATGSLTGAMVNRVLAEESFAS